MKARRLYRRWAISEEISKSTLDYACTAPPDLARRNIVNLRRLDRLSSVASESPGVIPQPCLPPGAVDDIPVDDSAGDAALHHRHHRAPSTVHRLLSPRRAARPAPRRAHRHRPATLRLSRCQRAVDERCHARAEGRRRAPAPKDLPPRICRRCHPSDSLRRLRPLREHHRVPARVQAGHLPARTPRQALRR